MNRYITTPFLLIALLFSGCSHFSYGTPGDILGGKYLPKQERSTLVGTPAIQGNATGELFTGGLNLIGDTFNFIGMLLFTIMGVMLTMLIVDVASD